MEDPASNSHTSRETPKPKVAKRVEQVVSEGNVVEEKKSLGRKFKDLFAGADARGALHYVVIEVLAPAAKNMVLEATSKGMERIMYPDAPAPGRRIYGPTAGSRVSYSSVGYRPPKTRPPAGRQRTIDVGATQRPSTDYVISSRTEAETVVERMGDLLETYNVVTVADLHDLIGLNSVHTDNKWGWDSLRGVDVRPVREGFLITLPPPEPISY